MVILLAFDPCGGLNGTQRNPCKRSRASASEERAIVRVYILGPAALAITSQALWVFLAYGDVEAGHVTIVLANLLEPGMVCCWVGCGFDS